MKKVLHILNMLLPSGAETMLKNSAYLWEGYEKHILATLPDEGEYAETLEEAGYQIHHIYSQNKKDHFNRIRQFVLREQFEVVHIHCEGRGFEYACIMKMAGIKSIVRTVHNVFVYTGVQKYKRLFQRWIERRIGVKYVAIGRSVYNNEMYWLKNKCYCIINNWCDEAVYQLIPEDSRKRAREKLNVRDNTFCVVSVGNCNDVKNHEFIIEALARLKKDFSEKIEGFSMVYFHVGSGVNEEEEKKFAQKLGVMDCIRFLGRQEPLMYLAASNAYLMPSKFEGLSISGLEAISVGIPTLFTDVAGLIDFKEICIENVRFCNLEIDSFYEEFKNLYIDFLSGNLNFSQDQIKQVRKFYSMDKSVKKYLAVYQV